VESVHCAIIAHTVEQHHRPTALPRSQGDLIRRARGELTQSNFAKLIGVERSCLSRYESEKLGAPTKVLNYCLCAIAAQIESTSLLEPAVAQALVHARQAVSLLENASDSLPPS
jgi:DNA-binding XRE family transcriptional regulator